MKILTTFAVLVFLAFAPGCEKATATGPRGQKLTLFKPMDQMLKQGETEEIAVRILRENFEGEVRVTFLDLPQGVTAISTGPIPAGRDSAVYTLHAAPDAGLVGNHMARVKVDGPDGLTASEMFAISVEARKLAGK
jgi:hypothetical protein